MFLDKAILRNYLISSVIEGNQDFGVWHDEFWMMYIYGQAYRQAISIFERLNSVAKLRKFDYRCRKDGSCSLLNLNGDLVSSVNGFNSFCHECHYSNVEVRAKCDNFIINIQTLSKSVGMTIDQIDNILLNDLNLLDNTGCIVCIEILEDNPNEESMEKCYARSFYPFSDVDSESSDFIVKDLFREKSPETFAYLSSLWDLKGMSNRKWKLYDIAEWFYKDPKSMKFSIVNAKSVEQILMDHPSTILNYPYKPPCDISFPIYGCKNWICSMANDEFFPLMKIAYNPQESNDTEYETIYSLKNGVFNESLMHEYRKWKVLQGENLTRDNITNWIFELGSLDPSENHSYFDVASRGINTAKTSDYSLNVYGLNEGTDLRIFVQEIEEKNGERNFISIFLILIIILLY